MPYPSTEPMFSGDYIAMSRCFLRITSWQVAKHKLPNLVPWRFESWECHPVKPGNFVWWVQCFCGKNGVTLIVLACTGFQSSIVLGCFLLLVFGSVLNHVNVYTEFTKDLAQSYCWYDMHMPYCWYCHYQPVRKWCEFPSPPLSVPVRRCLLSL